VSSPYPLLHDAARLAVTGLREAYARNYAAYRSHPTVDNVGVSAVDFANWASALDERLRETASTDSGRYRSDRDANPDGRVIGGIRFVRDRHMHQTRHIAGRAKVSRLKNRWAADVAIDLTPLTSGSMAVCKVDMADNKHFGVLADVAEALGDDAFDDRGLGPAVERLGKSSRLFGRKEIRHLRNILNANESVLELGTVSTRASRVWSCLRTNACSSSRRVWAVRRSRSSR
jgi:hypothetical protein